MMAEELTGFSYMTTLIAAAFAGGVSGYILRRLQKFEDTRDELRVKVLPQIYTATSLFLQTIEQFSKKNIDKDGLQAKLEGIEESLKTQIFDLGAVALLKESKRKNIFDFYLNFSLMLAGSKALSESDLRTKFKEKNQKIAGFSTGELLELAKRVRLDVLDELKEYKMKLPLILMLVLLLQAVVSAIVTLLGK